MPRSNRHPVVANLRVQGTLQDYHRLFHSGVNMPGDPGIGRDSHLPNSEGMAPFLCVYQYADLHTRGRPSHFSQVLLINDWHLSSFHPLPHGQLPSPVAGIIGEASTTVNLRFYSGNVRGFVHGVYSAHTQEQPTLHFRLDSTPHGQVSSSRRCFSGILVAGPGSSSQRL